MIALFALAGILGLAAIAWGLSDIARDIRRVASAIEAETRAANDRIRFHNHEIRAVAYNLKCMREPVQTIANRLNEPRIRYDAAKVMG